MKALTPKAVCRCLARTCLGHRQGLTSGKRRARAPWRSVGPCSGGIASAEGSPKRCVTHARLGHVGSTWHKGTLQTRITTNGRRRSPPPLPSHLKKVFSVPSAPMFCVFLRVMFTV